MNSGSGWITIQVTLLIGAVCLLTVNTLVVSRKDWQASQEQQLIANCEADLPRQQTCKLIAVPTDSQYWDKLCAEHEEWKDKPIIGTSVHYKGQGFCTRRFDFPRYPGEDH